jgi:hypothetical protein
VPGVQLARPLRADEWLNAATTAAAIVVVSLLCFVPVATNDFWLDAAIGRVIWTTGALPHTALFPFTEARNFPFHPHEWLASLAFYLLDRQLGSAHLLFVQGLLGLALFGLAYRLAHRLTRSFAASLLIALASLVTSNYRFYLRPELFALIFTALVLNLLVEYRLTGKRRYLVACAPIALAWANIHGSAPVALVLAAAFAAEDAWSALRAAPPDGRLRATARAVMAYGACTALMALALLVNPRGIGVFSFAWGMESAAFLRANIYEWMPTLSAAFVGTRGFWAFALFLVGVAAVFAAGRRRLSAAGVLLTALFGFLALLNQRHIALFAIVMLYPVSLAIGDAGSRADRSMPLRAALLALLIAGAGSLVAFGNMYRAFPYFVESDNFSLLLAEYIDSGAVQGNVLNSYVLGGELIYRGYPRLRPAIDSRIDVYGEAYFLFLKKVLSDEPAFREFVSRYDVHYVLLQWPEFNAGLRHMAGLKHDGWHIAFADNKAVLLARPGR